MTESSSSQLVVQSRIGVIGDIHTRIERLAWAIGVLRAQHVERIFATGDIADGLEEDAVVRACAMLQEANAVTVLGNHDRWLLDEQLRELPNATDPGELDPATRAYLQSLPASVEVTTPLGGLLFGHGLGSNDMSALYPHDHGPALTNNTTLQSILKLGSHRLVVGGHTHQRMVRTIEGVTFINAGALDLTREPCCLMLDFIERQAVFFDYQASGETRPGPVFRL
jgi:predicted phosphodiesterase